MLFFAPQKRHIQSSSITKNVFFLTLWYMNNNCYICYGLFDGNQAMFDEN